MMKTTGMRWGVCALAVVALAGCAGTGGGSGPSDEEVIGQMIADAMAALQAGDIDKMLVDFAENFSSDQGGDLATQKEFLQGVQDQGFLDDLSVNMDDLEITVTGDKAEAEGIELEGAFGAISLGFEFEKQDGAWKVTYQSQY